MSSEPPRASLLRALFKMEPAAAASEVLGGASEFVKGESGGCAVLRCLRCLPRAPSPSSRRSAHLAASVGPLCLAVLLSRPPRCRCVERLSSFSSAAFGGLRVGTCCLAAPCAGPEAAPEEARRSGSPGPLCATRPSAVFQIASTSLLCGISPKVRRTPTTSVLTTNWSMRSKC